MKEFVEYLFTNIVSKPEEVVITETSEGMGTIYRVRVAKEDMGTVIGKEGRNIKSIRNVAKAKAIKDNIHVDIVLEETGDADN
jgi:hypothetical protein